MYLENYEFSTHAIKMKLERDIKDEWIVQTILNYESIIEVHENEVHLIKQIIENDNRFLRIVVNPKKDPKLIITLFFDRRLRRLYENQN